MPTIGLAGRDRAFLCGADDTIMRAAVRAGLGFPYECNVGSCGTCRFELFEGTVRHLRTEPPAYSDRDRQRNRWLGCQASPAGDCVIKVNLNPRYESLHKPRAVRAQLLVVLAVTHDISEFRFKLSAPVPFLPGQYALFDIPGVDGSRPYSMCNVDAGGGEWHFQIRRIPSGAATSALFDTLSVGDTITVDGPYGTAYLRENAPRNLLCLAGGSGLSPMISIARGAAASRPLADREIHFVYGGRTPRDICGEPLLAQLPGFGERIFYYPSVSVAEGAAAPSWEGRTGFVHEVADAIFGPALAEYEIYFAGPPLMAEAVQRVLHARKVPPQQIHFDQFF